MIPLLLAVLLGSSAPGKANPLRVLDGPAALAVGRDGAAITSGKVGEWVTYRLKSPRMVSFLRIAVVGEERDVRGRPAVWVELDAGGHHAMEAPMVQLRLLVARGSDLDGEGITRAFVALATGKPQEVEPAGLEEMFRAEKLPANPPKTFEHLKVDARSPIRMMTLAGTVSARRVDLMIGPHVIQRYWTSDQIPLLKLAKLEIPAASQAMEVRDYGVDARPRMVLPNPDERKLNIEPGGDVPPVEDEEEP